MIDVEKKVLHFTIDGEWFTWLLRHLWIEGNEVKAIKTWVAAFPDRSSSEDIKTTFLGVVSGKRKFSGNSDGDGFQYEKDNTKYWSTTAGDKPNKNFPLLQSWEDVLLLKKIKLYINELWLRDFRLSRKYPDTYEDNGFNVLRWSDASNENHVENAYRQKVSQYYTEIRNLSYIVSDNIDVELLPEESSLLHDKNRVTLVGRKKDNSQMDTNLDLYTLIKSKIDTWHKYFIDKYGQRMFFFNEEDIKNICRLEDKGFIPAEEEVAKLDKAPLPENYLQQSIATMMIPGLNLNLDDYIKNSLEESKRDKIMPENLKTTKYTSGYIDLQGKFYGCMDINHLDFSRRLCETLGYCDPDTKDEDFDAQIHLEKLGWVKISVSRFYWNDRKQPNKKQRDTMFDYMVAKKIEKTFFNSFFLSDKMKSFAEAFND